MRHRKPLYPVTQSKYTLLSPEQARQLFFAGGGEFFLCDFLLQGAKRFDLVRLLAAPIDEGAFGDVKLAGDVVQAPALGAKFNEFFDGISMVHTFGYLFSCVLFSVGSLLSRSFLLAALARITGRAGEIDHLSTIYKGQLRGRFGQ